MPLSTEQLTAMLIGITRGDPPPAHEDDEAAAIRKKLTREVAAIRKAGGVVEIPPEIAGDE